MSQPGLVRSATYPVSLATITVTNVAVSVTHATPELDATKCALIMAIV